MTPIVQISRIFTSGACLGHGDPTPGFALDFEPLVAEDLERYLRHVGWLQADLLAQVHDLSPEQLAADPPAGGRSLYRILEHVAESDAVYLRYLVGPVNDLAEARREVREGPQGVVSALAQMWEITRTRFAGLTAAERAQLVPHGQVTWTARRAVRRILEHEWEHLQEIEARLEEY
jgi:uncharacterized damage-inducible protein DinB